MIKNKLTTSEQKGEIIVIAIAAMGLVLFTVLSVIAGAQIYFSNAAYASDAEKATALAEAGIDKALNSLNKTGGVYLGEGETSLGDGSYSVVITSKDASTKIIESTGYIPDKTKPKVKRTIQISTSKGVGASFVYGIQVGEGGLELGKHNTVTGTIYSNGNISSDEDNHITGDAWVAGAPQPTPDQSTEECDGVNCQDFIFGKNVNGETRMDVAQSFKPSGSGVLNHISVYIKKVDNPPNVNVRILQDASGKPDKNAVLATGLLDASKVTGSFGWIDVTFDSTPALTAESSYWLMIDTSADNNNYWIWRKVLSPSYSRGLPKWSADWQAKNAIWNDLIPDGDLSFKVYLGGAATSIRAIKDMTVDGNVHANTIEKLTVGKDAYYQTIIDSKVSGVNCTNNSHCHPNTADPAPKAFPISDANVLRWKADAEAGGTTGSVTSCVNSLGPVKIVGNLTFTPTNNCNVTVKGTIWITGNFSANNKNTFKLDPSYSGSSGVIIVDGTVDLDNNNHFEGTGVGSSLLMVLSTYNSQTGSAITIKNNGNTGVFYAGHGIIEPGNNNTFKELTAWKIKLVNNSNINYETGLSSTLFSSGPSGTYSLVKGTYQVK